MSDYESNPEDERDAVYADSGDPEAPADSVDPDQPLPDSERPVPPSYDDPTSANDGLGTEEIDPPDIAGVDAPVEADPDELAKSDPDFQHHVQEENAGTSLDQPSEGSQ